MKAVRILSMLVGAALPIVTIGCGSGSQSPLAPSQGAIIQGTLFNTTASFGSSNVQGIRVSVVGTPLSTTTDAGGRFTLGGVSEGRAVLSFEGQGVSAQLEISGLRDGQVLSIGVQVSGSQAFLTSSGPDASPTPSPSPSSSPSPNPGGEVEFRGKIDSISAPNLVVAGRLVRTDSSTAIRDSGQAVPFSALQAGQTVEVEGISQADGSVLARKVHIENGGDDGGDGDNGVQVEFKGTIQSIALPLLVVAGRTVATDGSTRILDNDNLPISLGALQVGQLVEVEGVQQSDQSVLARKIKLED